MIYANDNNDVYPPDLQTLVKKTDLAPKVLISPRAPKDFKGEHFIYIKGLNPLMDPEVILAYDNLEFCPDGVNVLFNDGHVQFMEPEAFLKAIEKVYKHLGKPVPEIKFAK